MINRNIQVSIPEGSKVYYDGRVMDVHCVSGKYIRKTIGLVAKDGNGKMYPNHNYFACHQNEFKREHPNSGLMLHAPELGVGLFALVLSIGIMTGIYPILCSVYGVEIANGIMDFVMYMIAAGSTSASNLPSFMQDQLMFSIKPHSDKWYSDLFTSRMNESANHQVRANWLHECVERGLTNVFGSIDGSNIDYVGRNNPLAMKGYSKSGTEDTIVGCIWLVCANGIHKGMPLTYFVTEGNVIDSKSFKRVITFVNNFELNLNGVIADRGFCTKDFFELLYKRHGFIVMLTENTEGYKEMLKEYGKAIRESFRYSIDGNGKFGVVDKKHLLSSSKVTANIALIYNDNIAGRRRSALSSRVYAEKEEYNQAVINDKDASISKTCMPYIDIDKDSGTASVNYSALDGLFGTKGYYGIAATIEGSAKEIDEVYNLRDASETSLSQIKTMLGFSAIRVFSEDAVLNKFLVGFVASIIRTEIMNACKELNFNTRTIINEAFRLSYSCNPNRYDYNTTILEKHLPFYHWFKLDDNAMRAIAHIVQKRFDVDEGLPQEVEEWTFESTNRSIKRNLPKKCMFFSGELTGSEVVGGVLQDKALVNETVENEHKALIAEHQTDKAKESETDCVPGEKSIKEIAVTEAKKGPGRGRRSGSKNKSTLLRERLLAEGRIKPPVKRPPGRPKSRETLEKEKRFAAYREKAKEMGIELPEKFGPGRPPKLETLLNKYQPG